MEKDNKIEFNITNICEIKSTFYKTFNDYLLMEGLKRTLPGITTLKDGINVYYSFYTQGDAKINDKLRTCINIKDNY